MQPLSEVKSDGIVGLLVPPGCLFDCVLPTVGVADWLEWNGRRVGSGNQVGRLFR